MSRLVRVFWSESELISREVFFQLSSCMCVCEMVPVGWPMWVTFSLSLPRCHNPPGAVCTGVAVGVPLHFLQWQLSSPSPLVSSLCRVASLLGDIQEEEPAELQPLPDGGVVTGE